MLLQQLRPQKIGNVARPGGGIEWIDTVTRMVIYLLAHSTPPSCISFNILSVAKVILTKSDFIHQIPGVEFIRLCRGTLLYLTKLLASNELSRAPKFLEKHADGTAR